jgi:hypothetical protein
MVDESISASMIKNMKERNIVDLIAEFEGFSIRQLKAGTPDEKSWKCLSIVQERRG